MKASGACENYKVRPRLKLTLRTTTNNNYSDDKKLPQHIRSRHITSLCSPHDCFYKNRQKEIHQGHSDHLKTAYKRKLKLHGIQKDILKYIIEGDPR